MDGRPPARIHIPITQSDDVAIWSDSGKGTFKQASITSQSGLGGGIMVTGSDNQTAFISVNLSGLFATGNTHEESGEPFA